MMRRAAILTILGLAQAGLASGCITAGALADFEYSQVFQPVRYPDGNWRPADLPVENAWFVAEDSTLLHGWYLPHEKPAGVVLFAHGHSGNVSTQAETLRTLHDRHRLSVL
ncbi:MAG: alpha/beta hydrolase, partial [Planctomycetaceae bacterium]|nr:alpha/beta hydrolase [Planctomycetaceae bacterium]